MTASRPTPVRHACPWCGVSLKGRLVRSKALPGQRKFLPMYAMTVCPECGNGLTYNPHGTEKAFGFLVGVPLLLLPLIGRSAWKSAIVGAVMVLWCVVLLYLHFRFWRHHPVWKRVEPDTGAQG